MACTWIPRARASTARDAAKAETAAFVVPYMTAKGLGMYEAVEIAGRERATEDEQQVREMILTMGLDYT